MKCPFCLSNETKVLDKRDSDENSATRRRRECLNCKKRFTTYERIETTPIIVVKKDKTREQFDRYKIKRGILKACEKRPISDEKVEKLIDEIESDIRNLDKAEVKSRYIGNLIIEKLKNLDQVAYVRFASVYRSFKDLKSFEKEINNLKK